MHAFGTLVGITFNASAIILTCTRFAVTTFQEICSSASIATVMLATEACRPVLEETIVALLEIQIIIRVVLALVTLHVNGLLIISALKCDTAREINLESRALLASIWEYLRARDAWFLEVVATVWVK